MAQTTDLQALLGIYRELGRQISAEDTAVDALHAITLAAVKGAVPGVDAASITRQRGSGYQSVGATDPSALEADALQYAFGSGPCVDAVDHDHVFCADELATDARWPEFGPAVAKSPGFHSVLSTRLTLDGDEMAGLNLYAYLPNAFDDHAMRMALLMATHGGVVVSRQQSREKAFNLATALESAREIGAAIGILMQAYKMTKSDAFDALRLASQDTNRKLRDVAGQVVETGTLGVRAGSGDPQDGGA